MADTFRLLPERRQYIENYVKSWSQTPRSFVEEALAEVDRLTAAIQVHHASGCPWYENDAALHAAVGLEPKPGPAAVPRPATVPLSDGVLKLYREWVDRSTGANPYVHINSFEALLIDYERLAAELRAYTAAHPPAAPLDPVRLPLWGAELVDAAKDLKTLQAALAQLVKAMPPVAPPADPIVTTEAELWKDKYELKAADYKRLKADYDQMENDFHNDFERQNKKIAELKKEVARYTQLYESARDLCSERTAEIVALKQAAKPADPLAEGYAYLRAKDRAPGAWNGQYRWWDGTGEVALDCENLPPALYEALLRHEGMSADREAVRAWPKCLFYRTKAEANKAAARAFVALAPEVRAELMAADSDDD